MNTAPYQQTLTAALFALPAELVTLQRSLDIGTRVRCIYRDTRAVQSDLEILFAGAGFEAIDVATVGDDTFEISATRNESLADWLRPDLRLLVCGLNPSPYAARTGIPFGRPGNRFWPAALAADLVRDDRDLDSALRRGVGFTDLVKRCTPASSELTAEEYRNGLWRLEHVARLFQPRTICFVGLEGVRKAIDAKAAAGWLARPIGGCRAYAMPSTSGRNASASLASLVDHLRCGASA